MALNDADGNATAMTTLYDVPAEDLIEATAAELADEDAIEAPDWVEFAKTGTSRELPPEQDDFWQRRAASLLRKVAVDGPVGVNSLRTEYGDAKGGSNRYQVRPPQKSQASGNVIRTALQQLEEVGYIEAAGGEGRRISSEGRAFLDELAGDVLQDLDRPELERYA
jgi:small subunit ribosomal protein S19e